MVRVFAAKQVHHCLPSRFCRANDQSHGQASRAVRRSTAELDVKAYGWEPDRRAATRNMTTVPDAIDHILSTVRCSLPQGRVFMAHVFERKDSSKYAKLIVASTHCLCDERWELDIESTLIEENVERADVPNALLRLAQDGWLGPDFMDMLPRSLRELLH